MPTRHHTGTQARVFSSVRRPNGSTLEVEPGEVFVLTDAEAAILDALAHPDIAPVAAADLTTSGFVHVAGAFGTSSAPTGSPSLPGEGEPDTVAHDDTQGAPPSEPSSVPDEPADQAG